jgi:4-amino-4-deoxy-L-arabinose transferase-like glycosyltransferase
MTAAGGARRTDRRDLLLAGLVAIGLLALCVAVQRGRVPSYDGKIAYATARAMADGRLHLLPGDDFFKANLPYSHYGIGMPLVILPLYLLQRALGMAPDLLVTLASPLLLAATGAVTYLSGRELAWSRRVSLAAALAAVALTQALQISQELLSESGIALSTALLILGMLRWRNRRSSGPWLAGVGVGAGLLFRSDSAALLGIGLLLLPAFVPWRRLLAERRRWIGLALPMLAALAWTAWYAELRDGSVVPAVYGGTFTTPLLTGLYGLLLSHGKSLFVYNPFLLLAIPGAVALWRRDRAATALLLLLAVVRPLFYARWSAWYGGVAWGPRFLMPAAVPLSLLAVYGVSRLRRVRLPLRVPAVAVVAGLVVASALVSALSVWVPYGASWTSATNPPPGSKLRGAALRQSLDRQYHAYFYSFDGSSIGYNLDRVSSHNNRFFPLTHFSGGAEPIGLAALVVAALAPLLAWALGSSRHDSAPPDGGGARVALDGQPPATTSGELLEPEEVRHR